MKEPAWNVLKWLYGLFGVPHPRASLWVVTISGALIAGAACNLMWRYAADNYKKNGENTPTTINKTSGPESPIINGNSGTVNVGK